jgi:hypothetical protein
MAPRGSVIRSSLYILTEHNGFVTKLAFCREAHCRDGPVLHDTLNAACMSKEQEDGGDTRKCYREDKVRELGRHIRLGSFAWWRIS